MPKIKEIANIIENIAPLELASDFDNVGLLIGDLEKTALNILLCLDVTDEVIDEAIENKSNLIISHHPMFIKPFKSINSEKPMDLKIIKLIKNDISIYTAHTNIDIAKGGLNDYLAEIFKLRDISHFKHSDDGIGRVGMLEREIRLFELADNIKTYLDIPYIRYVGDSDKIIKKVAICTGGGASLVSRCINDKEIDAFITGDIKYHDALEAIENNLSLIDAGHFETEKIFMPLMEQILRQNKIGSVKTKTNASIFKMI